MKTLFLVLALSLASFAQHDAHHQQVISRGEHAVGFSQTATAHHFLLKPDGGIVHVEAKSPEGNDSIEHIRMHLQEVREKFAAGDFSAPEFTHSRVPPGVFEMQRLKDRISYAYQETPSGAELHIASNDLNARAAIWKFLRFQIQDHRTGDSLKVSK
jgi:hypothetical protein